MARTRIKICGFTRKPDALVAAALGVDAIGLVFYPPSPRFVDLDTAREIALAMPPFVSVTGLFVNASTADVRHVLQCVPLNLLQFHGDEPQSFCVEFGLPFIKSVGVHDGVDLHAAARRYPLAAGLLLDNYDPVRFGGTGEVFDWDLIPLDIDIPVILAGGLKAENVARAVQRVRPYGVDVSGAVERGKGIKDAGKMAAFIRGVTSVESEELEA